MPQQFQVVQCYSCNVFQVDIVKKIPKWSCKMCGEKQSLKKVYVKASSKECRLVVQQLNEKRICLETEANECVPFESSSEIEAPNECLDTNREENSKWLEFMQENETNENVEVTNSHIKGVNKPESDNSVFENYLDKRHLNKGGSHSRRQEILANFDQFIPEKEKCSEKREWLQTSNLYCKKFKSDHNVQNNADVLENMQSKNIFDSPSKQDVDSLLEL